MTGGVRQRGGNCALCYRSYLDSSRHNRYQDDVTSFKTAAIKVARTAALAPTVMPLVVDLPDGVTDTTHGGTPYMVSLPYVVLTICGGIIQ